MDRRYRETQGTVDRGDKNERLISSYLRRAAAENRRVSVMGGSTGGRDPVEASRRRGMIASLRGAESRERDGVFEDSRSDVRKQAAG